MFVVGFVCLFHFLSKNVTSPILSWLFFAVLLEVCGRTGSLGQLRQNEFI